MEQYLYLLEESVIQINKQSKFTFNNKAFRTFNMFQAEV